MDDKQILIKRFLLEKPFRTMELTIALIILLLIVHHYTWPLPEATGSTRLYHEARSFCPCTGKVVDAVTNQPIKGAQVMAKAEYTYGISLYTNYFYKFTTTDEKGEYIIPKISFHGTLIVSSDFQLNVIKSGYIGYRSFGDVLNYDDFNPTQTDSATNEKDIETASATNEQKEIIKIWQDGKFVDMVVSVAPPPKHSEKNKEPEPSFAYKNNLVKLKKWKDGNYTVENHVKNIQAIQCGGKPFNMEESGTKVINRWKEYCSEVRDEMMFTCLNEKLQIPYSYEQCLKFVNDDLKPE